MRTYHAKAGEIALQWKILNGENVVLGRLATVAAHILMGKHKPEYVPYQAVGDGVIVINAEKIKLTGNKMSTKKYYHFSGYPGGMKEMSFEDLFEKTPEKVIELAVFGMLPKNKLGKQLRTRLKVYRGSEHPHEAQQPEAVPLPKRS